MLNEILQELVAREEIEQAYILNPADRTLLIVSIEDFVDKKITKFVTGGKEHNPKGKSNLLTSPQDMLLEAFNEVIDLHSYLDTEIRRRRMKEMEHQFAGLDMAKGKSETVIKPVTKSPRKSPVNKKPHHNV